MTRKQIVLLGGLGIVLVTGTLTGALYARDLSHARARIAAGSRIAQTACGPVEYADTGQGPPVLVIHGAGGGFDQGVLLGESLLGAGHRIIAPSRFGYLSSPLPADASVQAQAAAYASLLDGLGLEAVPVVAISAGGPSGLQFALDYPERTEALVMVSALSWMDPVRTGEDARRTTAINRVMGSDFLYWSVIHVARRPMLSLLGVTPELMRDLPPTEQQRVDAILDGMLPLSQRMPGIMADQGYTFSRDQPLESITAPVLVLHCRDDTLVRFEHGQHTADRIPGAVLHAMETGGHFSIGGTQVIQVVVTDFLAQ
ncbi:MAG: alpha/beta fold hydrolase [Anaerolineae bacterium]